ncbi:MAG: pyridoxamine 5'-phosphate oxidase family protein [Clostridiales bacterium]|nr:pyridoxamine 5'-phosphate oxidase family protein [Clostridiales bacterium]
MKLNADTAALMTERFGHDNLISLATVDGDAPAVRNVNAVYRDGSFYVVTYALSGKMRQLEQNPKVAICGEWFTARGVGESLGHILREENVALADMLRTAFAAWYSNGHTNESDPNTIILRIRLKDGVLFHHGTRYDIDFT